MSSGSTRSYRTITWCVTSPSSSICLGVHAELAPYYSPLGRPSIDPVLMIRMLIVNYVFAIGSERLLCREAKVNWRIASSAA